MHGALGAGRLGRAEDAALESPARIVVQRGAVVTERCILGAVMAAAIHPQHGVDRREFARAPREIRFAGKTFRHLARSFHRSPLYWY